MATIFSLFKTTEAIFVKSDPNFPCVHKKTRNHGLKLFEAEVCDFFIKSVINFGFKSVKAHALKKFMECIGKAKYVTNKASWFWTGYQLSLQLFQQFFNDKYLKNLQKLCISYKIDDHFLVDSIHVYLNLSELVTQRFQEKEFWIYLNLF